MRILSKKTLRIFWESPGRQDAEKPLKSWFSEAEAADWKNPVEIKALYSHASIVGDNRVVFNIGGNKYRLVVKMHYGAGRLFIRWVGTHDDYDNINIEEV